MLLGASLVLPAPAQGAETLRVLTYNLWHGFWRSPARELVVLPSERTSERRRRHALQSQALSREAPDIVLAQEVHPLPWRARELGGVLDHTAIHQLVSCGLRFLHVGIPWKIRSGLVITARPDLELERVASPVLSGRFGYCSDWLGLQIEEARRVLVGRVQLKDDRAVLVATTHLHSSTVGGEQRSERRVREVKKLLEVLERARAEHPDIAGIILGGDLNALEDAEPIELLRAHGFVDVARRAAAELPTYDPWENALAARMTAAGGGVPERSAPRRIDYLFVSAELAGAISSVERYGDGAVDSDHYGVVLRLAL